MAVIRKYTKAHSIADSISFPWQPLMPVFVTCVLTVSDIVLKSLYKCSIGKAMGKL